MNKGLGRDEGAEAEIADMACSRVIILLILPTLALPTFASAICFIHPNHLNLNLLFIGPLPNVNRRDT